MAMKYIGDGAWIHGVPARDLTNEEEKQHADLIAEQEQITGIKLYEAVKAKRKSRKGEQEAK
jgi:hypothetical protein